MEKLEQNRSEPVEVVRVDVRDVRTHPALQPRSQNLIKEREALRQEEQSERHVQDMAQLLRALPREDLEPLSLARVGAVLYVVDGHHRLKAYRRAKRAELPARVVTMTLVEASHASKLANVSHTKLEMLPAQKRNALWHHLAAITDRGSRGLPKGTSQRDLAGRFGVALQTVQRMLQKMPEVDRWEFPPEHCDGITKFPHWRYVCQSVRAQMYQALSPDARIEWKSGKYARRLLKLWEQFPPEAVRLAHERLKEEAKEAPEGADLEGLEAAWEATEGGAEWDF
jgi:hypothetical protein